MSNPASTRKDPPWIMIIGGIVLAAWVFNQAPQQPPRDNNTPRAEVSELQRIASAAENKQAVAMLAALYADFAEVLSRVEPGTLQSSQLRTWLIKSDTYLIRGTDRVGAVPGFGAAKDKIFADALGMEDRPLDAKDLAAAVAACRSIAAQLGAK